ncbi:hypothetical protein AALA22_02370 [Anaerovoracaceae bacterium 41-7]|uniref:Lipoprotein n=1 Tax=Anaerotruncus colihominis TaxID=169435 RepID=A0A845QP79_9FIRM|nr:MULTISPECIES: hypothetical protein [Eubacteriales]MCI9640202.1 hypothetical protein [Emergencia sp.]NBH61838.1 hypothetical protein [Anaerotruncus colihominis]NCF02493.1 hypothetical protein [Anaerotruncus sp. 80]
MKVKIRTITLVSFAAVMMFLVTACSGKTQVQTKGQILMEKSCAAWTDVIEKACEIKDFGRPCGTAKESLEVVDGTYSILFDIDEEMNQELVDGYAQSVWRACEKRSGESNQSSSGYHYASMTEASKRQEPLNYYIWYYRAGEQKFRVGLYPTNMETGIPGGLVLRIEPWE